MICNGMLLENLVISLEIHPGKQEFGTQTMLFGVMKIILLWD
jgi:hypothetical protein